MSVADRVRKNHKSWGGVLVATWIGSPLGTSGVDGCGIMEQRVFLNLQKQPIDGTK